MKTIAIRSHANGEVLVVPCPTPYFIHGGICHLLVGGVVWSLVGVDPRDLRDAMESGAEGVDVPRVLHGFGDVFGNASSFRVWLARVIEVRDALASKKKEG